MWFSFKFKLVNMSVRLHGVSKPLTKNNNTSHHVSAHTTEGQEVKKLTASLILKKVQRQFFKSFSNEEYFCYLSHIEPF